MDWVWMTHPNLDDRVIHVRESAVPLHEASGWKKTEDPRKDGMTDQEFIERYGYDPNPDKA